MEHMILIIILAIVLIGLVIYNMTMIGLMASQNQIHNTKSATIDTKHIAVDTKYKIA